MNKLFFNKNFLLSSYILRRPQNFAKSSLYFWLELHRTKVRGRFRKILWPSQNIWTLQNQRDFVPSLDLKEDSMLKMSPILGIQFSNKAVTIFTYEINMYKVSSIKLIGNSRSNSPSVLELSILIELTFWKVMLSFDIFFPKL